MTQEELSELSFQAIKASGFKNGDYTEDRDLEDVWEQGFRKAVEVLTLHLKENLETEAKTHADDEDFSNGAEWTLSFFQNLSSQ